MKQFISTSLFAAAVFTVACMAGSSVAATPTAGASVSVTSSCQWQFLYQERVGNPSQYGTIIDWYGAVGSCPYSRKGYNYRTSSWIYAS
jgi:hypothetical protein